MFYTLPEKEAMPPQIMAVTIDLHKNRLVEISPSDRESPDGGHSLQNSLQNSLVHGPMNIPMPEVRVR